MYNLADCPISRHRLHTNKHDDKDDVRDDDGVHDGGDVHDDGDVRDDGDDHGDVRRGVHLLQLIDYYLFPCPIVCLDQNLRKELL